MLSSDSRKHTQVLAMLLLHDPPLSHASRHCVVPPCLPPPPNHKLNQPEPICPIPSYIPVTRRFHYRDGKLNL